MRTAVLAVLLLAICVTLWSMRRFESVGEQHDAEAATDPGTRKLLTIAELHMEGWGRARPKKETDVGVHRPEPEIDNIVADILSSDPALQRFHELRRKALRNSTEQQDYLDMISDESLIKEAHQDLLTAASSLDIDQSEELRRLHRVQFFNSALAWNNNPKRAIILSAVADVVRAEIPANATKPAKGSALGDKFDLFQILMMSDRTQAQALLNESRGTRLEKVLQLAWASGPSTEPFLP